MTARRDEASGTIWNEWHPQPRPCVTLELLKDFRLLYSQVACGEIETDWFVTWSSHPTAFSLGGDLDLFRRCVQSQDWATLDEYADLCIDAIYHHVSGFGKGVNSIAVVQGSALGGGFETVLAMDFVIAEPAAEFGLPEMLFNLFPGMGAYSLLTRKIGPQKAKSFIIEGNVHNTVIMQEFGLVDQVVAAGGGLAAAERFIARWRKHRHGLKTFCQALRCATTETSKTELSSIVRQWVEAARGLTPRDLRMMDLLVRAQHRLKGPSAPAATQESKNPFEHFPAHSVSPFGVKQIVESPVVAPDNSTFANRRVG